MNLCKNICRSIRKLQQFTIVLIVLGFSFLWNAAWAADQKINNPQPIRLTLKTAIDLALRHNRRIAGSVYARENAALSLEAARSAFDVKWAPSARAGIAREDESTRRFGTGVLISKQFDFGAQACVGPGIDFEKDDYSADVAFSLAVPLLKGFGKAVALDPVFSARQGLTEAQRRFHLSRVSTVLDTVSAVYTILQQEALVRLYETQADTLAGQARLAKAKERAGLATPMDIYRAEIQAQDAQERLSRAREAVTSAKDRLKLILAIPPENPLEVTAPETADPVAINEEDAIVLAFENRVELTQAKDAVKEARRRAEIAKNNIQPGVDLVLRYRLYSDPEAYFDTLQMDETAWSINLVSTTDWTRKAEKAAYYQSLNAIKTAELQLEAKKDEIKEEVRRQLDALKKNQERIQIRKDQIRQARGKLALSNIKFRYNLADNFDLIEAAVELRQAEADLLAAETDYIVGIYRLRAALGTLLEKPEEN